MSAAEKLSTKAAASSETLLRVDGFSVVFRLPEGDLHACSDVSFEIAEGESLGVVGESGSGKSVTVLSMMGLLEGRAGRVETKGRLEFRGKPMSSLETVRGREVSMVFQNPLNSLNPSLKIGLQLSEVLIEHLGLSEADAEKRVVAMMERLAIPDPEKMMKRYPFEYSGGMRQRVMIAMAMLCEPALLIADEPTTALDVTIQAQILELMNDLRRKIGTSIMLITHDLGVVSETCSRVLVMYGGQIMEEAPAEALFATPLHPYTQGLLRSIPLFGGKERLVPIKGTPPDLLKPPAGCPFVERCKRAMRVCVDHRPPFYSPGPGRRAACWRLDARTPREGGTSNA